MVLKQVSLEQCSATGGQQGQKVLTSAFISGQRNKSWIFSGVFCTTRCLHKEGEWVRCITRSMFEQGTVSILVN